jgi:hypothetical protein
VPKLHIGIKLREYPIIWMRVALLFIIYGITAPFAIIADSEV